MSANCAAREEGRVTMVPKTKLRQSFHHSALIQLSRVSHICIVPVTGVLLTRVILMRPQLVPLHFAQASLALLVLILPLHVAFNFALVGFAKGPAIAFATCSACGATIRFGPPTTPFSFDCLLPCGIRYHIADKCIGITFVVFLCVRAVQS